MQPALKPWLVSRQSGVLAHISSLPSDTGIGNLGRHAYRFVDFLAAAGFSAWQVCPVGPTGYGDSPYQSFSAFAGNPYFIDLQELVELELLSAEEVAELSSLPREYVDYGSLYKRFWLLLEIAYSRFERARPSLFKESSLEEFERAAASWLDPYTSFMALKRRFLHVSWTDWPHDFRSSPALARSLLLPEDLAEKSRHAFYQYLFFSQWHRLKSYANQHGVELIGDLPIYVALDSADAWANRSNFRITPDGGLDGVAGVPPDYFSATGQRWGNPLYDWDELQRAEYRWWIERIEATQQLFDIIRLDHFRGFHDFWVVPADAPVASVGHWESGPGIDFFQVVGRSIANPKLIAEDLGYINQGVFDLRIQAGLPGMKILQFGYGHDDNNVNLPHFYAYDQVVYTGTHDNDTTQGWIDNLEGLARQQVFDYFDLHDAPRASKLVQAALASVARLVVTPLQDLLELPSTSRMNCPGTATGNWQWRFAEERFPQLFDSIAPRYRQLHTLYHRIGDNAQRDYSAPPAAKESFPFACAAEPR